MLWKYLHHFVREAKESSTTGDPYSFMLPDQFCSLTWWEYMSWRLEVSNQSTFPIPSNAHRGYTQQDSRHESKKNAYQVLAFKKRIKREVSQYTILKDDKYFEAFKRNLLVTATTHDCEEILDGNYEPENNTDSKELFKQKKYFMYTVFNKVLQSDMGKTIVRKYGPSLDAQSVWWEFESHMFISSKGLNERHRLHAYVSTTVYEKSWKSTTEQFVLHLHKQFRQLDEVTPLEEHLPHSVRLTLLQTAVRSVPEPFIVETMEEYMSLTQSSTVQYSLTYDKYFMMLQNACIMYDETLKHKPSTTSRAVYQHEVDDEPSVHDEEDDYLDDNFSPDGIDTSSYDKYNIHNTDFKRTPHVKSLIPRRYPGKLHPHKAIPPKPRYK